MQLNDAEFHALSRGNDQQKKLPYRNHKKTRKLRKKHPKKLKKLKSWKNIEHFEKGCFFSFIPMGSQRL